MFTKKQHIVRKTMIVSVSFILGILATVIAAATYDANIQNRAGSMLKSIKSNASTLPSSEKVAYYTLVHNNIQSLIQVLTGVDTNVMVELGTPAGLDDGSVIDQITNTGTAGANTGNVTPIVTAYVTGMASVDNPESFTNKAKVGTNIQLHYTSRNVINTISYQIFKITGSLDNTNLATGTSYAQYMSLTGNTTAVFNIPLQNLAIGSYRVVVTGCTNLSGPCVSTLPQTFEVVSATGNTGTTTTTSGSTNSMAGKVTINVAGGTIIYCGDSTRNDYTSYSDSNWQSARTSIIDKAYCNSKGNDGVGYVWNICNGVITNKKTVNSLAGGETFSCSTSISNATGATNTTTGIVPKTCAINGVSYPENTNRCHYTDSSNPEILDVILQCKGGRWSTKENCACQNTTAGGICKTSTNTVTPVACTGNGNSFNFSNSTQTNQCVGVMPTGNRGDTKTVNATQGAGTATVTCGATGWTVTAANCTRDKNANTTTSTQVNNDATQNVSSTLKDCTIVNPNPSWSLTKNNHPDGRRIEPLTCAGTMPKTMTAGQTLTIENTNSQADGFTKVLCQTDGYATTTEFKCERKISTYKSCQAGTMNTSPGGGIKLDGNIIVDAVLLQLPSGINGATAVVNPTRDGRGIAIPSWYQISANISCLDGDWKIDGDLSVKDTRTLEEKCVNNWNYPGCTCSIPKNPATGKNELTFYWGSSGGIYQCKKTLTADQFGYDLHLGGTTNIHDESGKGVAVVNCTKNGIEVIQNSAKTTCN